MTFTHRVIEIMLKIKHIQRYTVKDIKRMYFKNSEILFCGMLFRFIFIFIIFYIVHGVYQIVTTVVYMCEYVHVFIRVCLSACLCMCLFVCLNVFLTMPRNRYQWEDLSLNEHIKKIVSSCEAARLCRWLVSPVNHRILSCLFSYCLAIRNRYRVLIVNNAHSNLLFIKAMNQECLVLILLCLLPKK